MNQAISYWKESEALYDVFSVHYEMFFLHVDIFLFIDGWFMVFYATFNNISVLSWQSVLLVEETEVPGLYHIMLHRLSMIRTHNVSGDRY